MKRIIKKLIILLLFAFSINVNAQIWGVDFSQKDKEIHYAAGCFSGFVWNGLTYDILKDTKLKPWVSKGIGFIVGSASGLVLGHVKEKYDVKKGKVYSKKDLKATFLGGVSGSFVVRLALWGSIPVSKVPKGEIIYSLNNPIFFNALN